MTSSLILGNTSCPVTLKNRKILTIKEACSPSVRVERPTTESPTRSVSPTIIPYLAQVTTTRKTRQLRKTKAKPSLFWAELQVSVSLQKIYP